MTWAKPSVEETVTNTQEPFNSAAASSDAPLSELIKSLFELALSGDAEAYSEFLKTVTPMVREVAAAKLPNPDWVEDVVQESILAIHFSRQTFTQQTSIINFVVNLTEQESAKFQRTCDWVLTSDLTFSSNQLFADFVNGEVESEQGRQKLKRLLAQLPDGPRRAIEGLKLQNQSLAEIAEQQTLTTEEVKLNAFRGYQWMRRMMRARSA